MTGRCHADEDAVHRVAATLCGLGDSCCVNTLKPCEYEGAARDAIEAFQELPPITNPKTAAGLRKLPLDLIPPIALVEMAAVLGLGADCPAKAYGRWNWRDAPVEAETYVAALERHMLRWRCGEEIDDQTGVSHLASAMCCLAILRDAQEAGTFIDNRRGSPGVLAVMDRYDASSMPVVKAA